MSFSQNYGSKACREAQPFIEHANPLHVPSPSDMRPFLKEARLKNLRYGIYFHSALIVMYTIVFGVVVWSSQSPAPTALYPIPSLKFSYISAPYTDFEHSPFSGPPSESVDKAWHNLLAKTTLRVSHSELQLSNQASVELPEGGYMAWLGVYHQLHCIKMLRQWNYREHYHPNITEDDRPHWDIHADHCLDPLRSAAMCHADTTLTTFGWADQAKPMLNTRPISHKCVDWGKLIGSVEDRAVSREEMASLVNPKSNMA
ncbi:Cyclochlorotine biosynthesis protein R [Lachnellula suecica]|uniref:Cyclochlorotine biosynthesis protein R n=1 Tax=Lachnellula suecica TaxID=602035 RepID=A0A8T9CBV6_9HELO|nr:Cyclochlorotine biosynthesis protein R [Lachnellula suecica]